MKVILLMVTPIIFSTFIYSANTALNNYLFAVLMERKDVVDKVVIALQGEYSGHYSPLINIPLALSSATSSAMLPEIAALHAQKQIALLNDKVHTAIRLTMFIVIPAAMGLSVLSFPIMAVLFPRSTDVSGYLLMFGSFSVIFAALSTIMNGVLQAIGKPRIPLRNAAISLVINLVALVGLLWFTDAIGIYAILIVSVLFSLNMCILNGMALKKYLGYQNEYMDTYIKPLLAAFGMGIVAWLVYYGLHLFLPIKIICLGLAIILGAITYIVLFVIISKTTEAELRRFPLGSYAVSFMKLIRIYK